MGRMKVGSGASSAKTVVTTDPSRVETVAVEKEVIVEIPKPVTKEVEVEVQKPRYKVVEVEEVVKKPKIRVDEVPESVIKPVFTIKQETIVLDKLQKKLEQSVELAASKLSELNSIVVEKNIQNEELASEIQSLNNKVLKIQIGTAISAAILVAAVVASLIG